MARHELHDGRAPETFGLTEQEEQPPDNIPEPADDEPPVHQVWRRITAPKHLTIDPLAEKDDLNKKIAEAAIDLARQTRCEGKRIVVFTHKPDDAATIARLIRATDRPKKTKADPQPAGPFADAVDLLTGTLRGKERDELVEKPVFKERWLNGELKPDAPANQSPVFLVATSAGEVGLDLNADHMVCDLTTIDAMIQRLGRVNRRGMGRATISLLHKPIKATDKDGKPKKLEGLDLAHAKTLELLTHVTDVSPRHLSELRKSDAWNKTDDPHPDITFYELACSPTPTIPPATDILFDAWSLTSIRGKMPGRPPVEPYLHGIDDDAPQTTIAFRAELDLLDLDTLEKSEHPRAAKALRAILAKHRVRPHETITTAHHHVASFLKNTVKADAIVAGRFVAVVFPRGQVEFHRISDLANDPGVLRTQPIILLPASLDSLNATGMLDAERIKPPKEAKKKPSPDTEADATSASRWHDVADHPGYEPQNQLTGRCRLLIEKTGETWSAKPLHPSQLLPDTWNIQPVDGPSTALVRNIKQNATGLRVTLIQPLAFDDEGDPTRSLVCLSPASQRNNQTEQTLVEHVNAVVHEAERLVGPLALNLPEPFRKAVLFAADWHDEGKKAAIWQRYIGGPDANGKLLGKSADWCDPCKLAGYRHEFGSLLRIPDAELPTDQDTRDLALHLIASHHGQARPHFPHPFDHDYPDADCERIHTESIQRFARLQRTYGRWGLAYLESLLRAADIAASRAAGQDPNDDDDAPDTDGGDA